MTDSIDYDDSDPWITLAMLESEGLTQADVRRLYPHAVEYGSVDAPYWHRDDLADLL